MEDFKIYKDCKLMPLVNPHCMILNEQDDIIKMFNKQWVIIEIEGEEIIVGYVANNVYIKDDFYVGGIFVSLLYNNIDFSEYEWVNTEIRGKCIGDKGNFQVMNINIIIYDKIKENR